MFMGNLLAGVMTFSLQAFRDSKIMMGGIQILALVIYLLLVGVPAYKDGLDENTMSKKKQAAPIPAGVKYRWLAVGGILWGTAVIPSAAFLFGLLGEGVYKLISGAAAPLSWILVNSDMRLFSFAPYVFMGVYALTVPACHVGFMLGFHDKLNKDNMMYK